MCPGATWGNLKQQNLSFFFSYQDEIPSGAAGRKFKGSTPPLREGEREIFFFCKYVCGWWGEWWLAGLEPKHLAWTLAPAAVDADPFSLWALEQ